MSEQVDGFLYNLLCMLWGELIFSALILNSVRCNATCHIRLLFNSNKCRMLHVTYMTLYQAHVNRSGRKCYVKLRIHMCQSCHLCTVCLCKQRENIAFFFFLLLCFVFPNYSVGTVDFVVISEIKNTNLWIKLN